MDEDYSDESLTEAYNYLTNTIVSSLVMEHAMDTTVIEDATDDELSVEEIAIIQESMRDDRQSAAFAHRMMSNGGDAIHFDADDIEDYFDNVRPLPDISDFAGTVLISLIQDEDETWPVNEELEIIAVLLQRQDGFIRASVLALHDFAGEGIFLPPVDIFLGPIDYTISCNTVRTDGKTIQMPYAANTYMQDSLTNSFCCISTIFALLSACIDTDDDDFSTFDALPNQAEMWADITREPELEDAVGIPASDDSVEWLMSEIELHAKDMTIVNVTSDEAHEHLHLRRTEAGLKWDEGSRERLQDFFIEVESAGIIVRTVDDTSKQLRGYHWEEDESGQHWFQISAEELLESHTTHHLTGERFDPEEGLEYC